MMNSTLEYSRATVEIIFPKDRICCDYCPLMETYARKQCRRTGEYLVTPDKHELTFGMFCPLKVKEDNDGVETDSRI